MFTSWIYVEEKTSKLCYTVTLIASCPILGPIRNGVITHVTRKSGGEVEIKCRANYTLFGSSKLSCINGEWSSSIPSCKGMSHTCDHQSRNKKRKANFHGLHLASTWPPPHTVPITPVVFLHHERSRSLTGSFSFGFYSFLQRSWQSFEWEKAWRWLSSQKNRVFYLSKKLRVRGSANGYMFKRPVEC